MIPRLPARSCAKQANAASTRMARDDGAVLRGRGGIGSPRPAALEGSGFDPARGRTAIAAEMPAVPRCVADRGDGDWLLGSRRRVDARDARGVLGGRGS